MTNADRSGSPRTVSEPFETAFYPCCAEDIVQPLFLLAGYVKQVVFCDTRLNLERVWARAYRPLERYRIPNPVFVVDDARVAIERFAPIDVLFYRRDSMGGEGGSGLAVLCDEFLGSLMKHFSPGGGYVITDGSNSHDGSFTKMLEPDGLEVHGFSFKRACAQPFERGLGLSQIGVSRTQTNGHVSPKK